MVGGEILLSIRIALQVKGVCGIRTVRKVLRSPLKLAIVPEVGRNEKTSLEPLLPWYTFLGESMRNCDPRRERVYQV